ncbi:MAG TPA: ABC transporter permease, partial [Longimicrobiales bacterium]|nr:ABC transporter permease [Longimicrobiales bacterium]
MPPRLTRRILNALLPPRDREVFPGELDDVFESRVRRDGRFRARWWYRRQVLDLAVRLGGGRAGAAASAILQAVRETISMDTLVRELRHGLRGLSRRPAFTVIAVLSLALGIGANTGVFSLVNAVLLRPLPVERPDELVELYTQDSDGYLYATSSWPDVVDLREATGDVFQGVAAYRLFVSTTERAGRPVVLMGEAVSRNYFELLGVRPALGRAFAPDEGLVAGRDRVALVGHVFWQREMEGDPNAVGSTIRLNRRPLTVIGVLPEDFHGMIPALVPDVWVPVTLMDEIAPGPSPATEARGSRSLFVKARLRRGVTLERAGEVVRAVASRLAEAHPDTNEGRTMSVLPTEGVSIHPMVDRALVPVAGLLLSVVGIVLLITCANLASFLLARAEDRRRDVAVRLALGAGRWSVVRPFMAETILLALGGGVAGVLLARWMVG